VRGSIKTVDLHRDGDGVQGDVCIGDGLAGDKHGSRSVRVR